MPSFRRYSRFDDLAWIYNKYWGDKFLPEALAALEQLALPRLPRDAAVLDLCCGTGQLAAALASRGYRVTGLDGSSEMLRYARQNAPAANFIPDDARTFDLPGSFHLVTSMFDSLNHILQLEELESAFHHVGRALVKGGLFLFDLNTDKGYRANWDGFYGIVEDDHVCLTRNNYDSKKRLATFEATIFRLKNGWRRSDVQLPEKCYTEAEVRSALGSAGFNDITALEFDAGSGFHPLTKAAERAFFICCKP